MSRAPLTVVTTASVTDEEIAARVRQTHAQHGEVCNAFHGVWYDSDHTWTCTYFLGVGVMKSPCDLWVYQDLIAELKPRTILETGTAFGGSALWYAYLMDMLGITDGQVLSVDLVNRRRCAHPRIQFVEGDCLDPALAADLRARVTHPLLISLDADHAEAHVAAELALYAPLIEPDEYLVVEDTNISWPGVDHGARAAVEALLRAHPGEWEQDLVCERYLTTMHPGGWLRRVKECACAPD